MFLSIIAPFPDLWLLVPFFGSKIRKHVYPVYPRFTIYMWYNGANSSQTCYSDEIGEVGMLCITFGLSAISCSPISC